MNLTITDLIHFIQQDAKRYGKNYIFHPGFWVVLSYRIRRLRKHGSPLYSLLLPIDFFVGLVRRILTDTALPSCVPIGSGLYIPHPNGIIINHMVEIGSQVAIFQQVTLGEWHGKAPKICNNSAIYGGAKVFGGITVGENCKVGANVVLNKDVPDNSSVSTPDCVFHYRGE